MVWHCFTLVSTLMLNAIFHSISNPCWNFVEGIDGSQSVILDLYNGTATNLQFENINVTEASGADSDTVICDPATLAKGEQVSVLICPLAASISLLSFQDTLGFNCTRGPFQTTEIKADNPGNAATAQQPMLLFVTTTVAVLVLGALMGL
jgi:hypothetical protein